jgi:hypothetical protein
MLQPVVYHVKPEHVGNSDLSEFLRSAISKQFDGKDFFIGNEQTIDKRTPYSDTPRKFRVFHIQVGEKETHTIYFDITDVSLINTIGWTGL